MNGLMQGVLCSDWKEWQKFAEISSREWAGTSRDSPHGGRAPQDGAVGHSSGSGFVVAGPGGAGAVFP